MGAASVRNTLMMLSALLATATSVAKQQGFVGLDVEGNLRLKAPLGSSVIVEGNLRVQGGSFIDTALASYTMDSVGHGLYVINGLAPEGDVQRCTRFNLFTGGAASTTPPPRAYHAASAFVANEKIWVVGGSFSSSLSVFNPRTSTWTQSSLPFSLHASASTWGPDGKWYTFGSADSPPRRDVWSFDPVRETFQKEPFSVPTGRWGACAFATLDSMCVLGGTTTTIVAKFECYNVTSQTWTTLADMPAAHRGHGCAVHDRTLLVFGVPPKGTVLLFHFDTNSWSEMSDSSPPRWLGGHWQAISLANRILVVHGNAGDGVVYWFSPDAVPGSLWTQLSNFEGSSWQSVAVNVPSTLETLLSHPL